MSLKTLGMVKRLCDLVGSLFLWVSLLRLLPAHCACLSFHRECPSWLSGASPPPTRGYTNENPRLGARIVRTGRVRHATRMVSMKTLFMFWRGRRRMMREREAARAGTAPEAQNATATCTRDSRALDTAVGPIV
jgi:hypothetical protein